MAQWRIEEWIARHYADSDYRSEVAKELIDDMKARGLWRLPDVNTRRGIRADEPYSFGEEPHLAPEGGKG